jgi:membrane protein implicated in regulation of membrane protease activity
MSASHRIAALALLLFALPAAAYIGPGSGISLLGGIWSVLVAIVLALAAILFWPIRLMVKRMRARKAGQQSQDQPAASGDDN